jgi:hypothetical protein
MPRKLNPKESAAEADLHSADAIRDEISIATEEAQACAFAAARAVAEGRAALVSFRAECKPPIFYL